MNPGDLDLYLSRLQNQPSWNIHAVSQDGHSTIPWFEVGPDIYRELVVNDFAAPAQAAVLGAEIQKWGRLAALARRVWQVEERNYVAWRSAYLLKIYDPEEKPAGWKRPTKEQGESMYRSEPRYHQLQAQIERAEEAYNATDTVVQALKAKKDALIRFTSRYHDGGMSTSQ